MGVKPSLFQHSAGLRADFKDARNARTLLTRPDHIDGCAPAQQKPEGVHDNRLSAPGLACQQIQTWMEPHSKAVDYGVIFNRQLMKHSIRL